MTKQWNTVWVTGASSGIGYEFSRLVAPKCGRLAVSARSADKLQALAVSHDNIAAYPLDVSNGNAVRETVSAIHEKEGLPDLAVLNAGIWQYMKVEDLDLTAIRDALEVNYMGVVYALEALLPAMIERGKGHIAIVASVAGYRGLPGATAYGPTKAALINLAETLRCELVAKGITITIVNPGFVDTPMTAVNDFPMPNIIPANIAAGRLLRGLERQHYEIVFPRRFVWQMKILRLLPNFLYFWAVRNFISGKKL